jgi:protein-tyrosine phosphatase
LKQEKILFVCTGNTCRSVIAQALFQKLKDELDPELNYQAYSAGIAAIEGSMPTSEAIYCMAKYGLDITTHNARQVDEQIIKNSSLILTMTNQQKNILKEKFFRASHKIFLFRPFCLQTKHIENKEVEDPYGKSISFYEDLCYLLENDIKSLINRLREDK